MCFIFALSSGQLMFREDITQTSDLLLAEAGCSTAGHFNFMLHVYVICMDSALFLQHRNKKGIKNYTGMVPNSYPFG